MAKTAIVDYGMGNLFSIAHMSAHVGLKAEITADPAVVRSADAVILPGVGAFGDAMRTLEELKMVDALRDAAATGKPFLGICLGLQLLFTESHEFGIHKGLGIIPGTVVRFDDGIAKVPHVGWNTVAPAAGASWDGTLLDGTAPDTFVYFVHSFFVKPDDSACPLTVTDYAGTEFCSGVRHGSVTAFQFHPERSGTDGLRIMENFRKTVG